MLSDINKNEILSRCGSIKQFAGAQRMCIEEGRGKNCSIIRVRNGGGLDFTIVPDRGLDIAEIYYKGSPLAWISNTGLTNAQQFDDKGIGWLRDFNGGMLVTCGLRNVGPPDVTNDEELGLHGRYTSLPSEHTSIKQYWKDDCFYIEVSAEIRESRVFGENLVCYRTISTNSQSNHITVRDRIVNEGFQDQAVGILYHCNWGYPLLDKDTNLHFNQKSHVSVKGKNAPENSWNQFSSPQTNFKEIVYLHEFSDSHSELAGYSLENVKLGLKLNVNWNLKQLPYLTQWKMTGQGEYVLGLEPGNCFPLGRQNELDQQRMDILKSFEEKEIVLDFFFSEI